jgi:polyhydroxybutyrate depolymerase
MPASPRFARAVFASPLLLAGCFGSNALPGASSSAPVHARAEPTAAPSSAVCAGRNPQPPNATWKVTVAGRERTFVVHVPPSYDPAKPTPVVLNVHGYRMTPKLEDWLTGMAAKADQAGFVVVYPLGTGSPTSFNGGACCGDAAHDGVDDVAFVRAILDALEADLCVDRRRVYATGMSNGGIMSHRLACELSDRIAAVAPVSGFNGTKTCAPARAVSVLDFHGTDDPTVPFGGDPKRGWLSIPATMQGWVERDGCSADGVEKRLSTHVRCFSHGGCRDGAEVSLCVVEGGGHTWPGGSTVPWIAGQGETNHEISADDLIWRFFEEHPMPER